MIWVVFLKGRCLAGVPGELQTISRAEQLVLVGVNWTDAQTPR